MRSTMRWAVEDATEQARFRHAYHWNNRSVLSSHQLTLDPARTPAPEELCEKVRVLKPHAVLTETDDASELKDLLEVAAIVTGQAIPTSRIEGTLEHEEQHRQAAVAIGSEDNLFGVRIVSKYPTVKKFVPRVIPFFSHNGVTAPEIAFIAVAAHPLIPSPSDKIRVAKDGYKSIDDFGALAERYNSSEKLGLQIPLPLSYVPKLVPELV